MSHDRTSPITSVHNEERTFTYSWTIPGFQDLVRRVPTGYFLYSDLFWSPYDDEASDFLISANRDLRHSWRLRMYPRGYDERYKSYLSVYLEGFQTQYEKENNLTRQKEFELELYRIRNDGDNMGTAPIFLACLKRSSQTFNFNNVINCGQHQFCSLENIFPNHDRNINTSLIIRVRIFENTAIKLPSSQFRQSPPVGTSQQIVLPPGFDAFFGDERLADVEFLFDCGTKIKSHRIVLAAQSSYFNTLLLGGWKEAEMETIPIKDTDHKAFRSLLYYFYNGKIERISNVELLIGVYTLADRFGLQAVASMATDQIIGLLNEENWDEILLLGWHTCNTGMKQTGIEFAANNWTNVKESDNTKRILQSQDINLVEELMSGVFFHR
ncbi:hypothetical protein G9A89_000993 [Geosiphon pyriformis]|nr:hypothetical protein G9A89_000993 [Geosiphon pyriformis]